ncbi:MAG: pyrimidine 5'-nucleotidase [Pseudomonadota bacterium]
MPFPHSQRQIDTWIFDLDDTLYPPEAGLLAEINRRITAFIVRELGMAPEDAAVIRARYWAEHGITLAGLIAEHRVKPDHFLADTHDIDLSGVRPNPALVGAIAELPGRRIVHTNGARAHAARVLAATGLEELFDEVYAIEDKGLIPKPRAEAYRIVLEHSGADPTRALMIEDTHRNLVEPRRLGMATAWLAHDSNHATPDHVDHRIEDLTAFLRAQIA